ncbi:LrgB family protein [Isoptericola sp. AK164]|uniref:LrgB family protein n=1 Tax=Isoptericola sp. AK164 TaxID=3024246 RepID=UPI0024189850|nr:LrgB family protein [Isoptericola sp. AK164]
MSTLVTDVPVWGTVLTLGGWVLAVLVLRTVPAAARVVPPILVAIVVVAAVLLVSDVPYDQFARTSAPLSALLGPAVVALALPVHRYRAEIAAVLPGLLTSALAGVVAAAAVVLGLAAVLDVDPGTVATLVPMHATSPVSSAVSAGLGGSAGTAAVVAIFAGVLGASAGPPLLRALRITDPRARGLAIGVSSHAIGTSRALEIDAETGTYAAIGMACGAVLVATTSAVVAAVPGLAALLP